jgi:hypothetical protein
MRIADGFQGCGGKERELLVVVTVSFFSLLTTKDLELRTNFKK